MSNCPVCNEPLIATICTTCGYDLSLSYEAYGSLTSAPKGKISLSGLRAQWKQTTEDHLCCKGCGSLSFRLSLKASKLLCNRCGVENPIPGNMDLEVTNAGLLSDNRTLTATLSTMEKERTALRKEVVRLTQENKALERQLHSTQNKQKRENSTSCGTIYGSCENYAQWVRSLKPESIVAIATGYDHTVGLRKDGTVVATGAYEQGQCHLWEWSRIKAIAAGGYHTVGLRENGTVVAEGSGYSGCCRVGDWTNIVAIAAGEEHTVGLRKDGTVIATGLRKACEVQDWKDVVAISAGRDFTVGLKKDGTVLSTNQALFDGYTWKDLQSIAAGEDFIIGLEKDGTVLSTGMESWRDTHINTEAWTDIVAIAAGVNHALGLRGDGTVVVTGALQPGQEKAVNWKNMIALSVGDGHTVGLKRDGTVCATGINKSDQCEVDQWGRQTSC